MLLFSVIVGRSDVSAGVNVLAPFPKVFVFIRKKACTHANAIYGVCLFQKQAVIVRFLGQQLVILDFTHQHFLVQWLQHPVEQ